MNDWSLEDAISMERRHLLEGAQRVARQEALLERLGQIGTWQLVPLASDVLETMRVSLEISRTRLQNLEGRAVAIRAMPK